MTATQRVGYTFRCIFCSGLRFACLCPLRYELTAAKNETKINEWPGFGGGRAKWGFENLECALRPLHLEMGKGDGDGFEC